METLGVVEIGIVLFPAFLSCLIGFVSVVRQWRRGWSLASSLLIFFFSWRLGFLQVFLYPSSGLMFATFVVAAVRASNESKQLPQPPRPAW